jgi:DNA-binding response OmpR family regulator
MMNKRTSTIGLLSTFATPPSVLVVDDSPDTLNMLFEKISGAGYYAFPAKNSDAAMKYLKFIAPDAILLDATSSGIGGFDLGRRIKLIPAYTSIPLLFMIEQANTRQIISSFESGGIDYVPKPLRIPEVLARLSAHITAHISAAAQQTLPA